MKVQLPQPHMLLIWPPSPKGKVYDTKVQNCANLIYHTQALGIHLDI
jgi:hypothetical protein